MTEHDDQPCVDMREFRPVTLVDTRTGQVQLGVARTLPDGTEHLVISDDPPPVVPCQLLTLTKRSRES